MVAVSQINGMVILGTIRSLFDQKETIDLHQASFQGGQVQLGKVSRQNEFDKGLSFVDGECLVARRKTNNVL